MMSHCFWFLIGQLPSDPALSLQCDSIWTFLIQVHLLEEKRMNYISEPFIAKAPFHGHLLMTAHKLSATKIEHSHWSTGHSTHL